MDDISAYLFDKLHKLIKSKAKQRVEQLLLFTMCLLCSGKEHNKYICTYISMKLVYYHILI